MGSKFSSSDFELYTRKIKDYPLLTPEEELDYARKYKQGDISAGQKIVTANLRFVVKISQGYFHLGYGPLEIVQEGNMGLVKALTRFDPEMGVRFICYAIWWIKAYIKNFIHKSYQVHTGRLTHAKGLISLDSAISGENENEECLLDHLLYEGPDQDDFYTHKERHAYLVKLLKSDPPILTKREVFIIEKRFFNDPPATLKDIALQIGVTRERVRQIEMRSLQRIRAAIEKQRDILTEDIHIGHEYPIRRKRF
ncbi:MAG TPA: sigma-70 family RNA polymerase sigma factor [Deltaproteobacteria bacterium]|nr:sigma-70 family RNA polymerase sigma factor [Deltaproteobacteria bacterium]HPJ92289.1 sigma-70 family RNA polymerase sigma factor [Deltaproteobacteria bacterium]HPR51235.1 sigma-70 family RNA polymerase sigma factor [Deltaproteobacteria bacterium]